MTEYANPFDAFGVDADNVDSDPFSIKKVDTYPFVVSGAEVKTFNEVPYFVIELTITDGLMAGRGANLMHRLIPWGPGSRGSKGDEDTMNARALSSYKKDLLDLGVPESAIRQFNPQVHGQKLVGIRGTATFGPQKNNPQYNSVSNLKVNGAATDSENIGSPVSVGTTTSTVATESLTEENVTSKLGNWA